MKTWPTATEVRPSESPSGLGQSRGISKPLPQPSRRSDAVCKRQGGGKGEPVGAHMMMRAVNGQLELKATEVHKMETMISSKGLMKDLLLRGREPEAVVERTTRERQTKTEFGGGEIT